MKEYKFAVIGGDFRYIAAANELITQGYEVKAFGFDEISAFHKDVICADTLQEALKDAEYILLPLPCCSEKGYITSPLFSGKINFSEMLSLISINQIVLMGKADSETVKKFEDKGIKYFDYLESEEFSVKNAVPTAEGAIEIALREMPVTLCGSNCLVTGFGRIAKLLASLLKAFGAHTAVAARRHSDLAWIYAKGYEGIYISELFDSIHKYDVIFNTVPHKIMGNDILKRAKRDALIIDLASKPGGVGTKFG